MNNGQMPNQVPNYDPNMMNNGQQPMNGYNMMPNQQPNKSGKGILIAIIVVLVLAIAGVGVFIIINNNNDKDKGSSKDDTKTSEKKEEEKKDPETPGEPSNPSDPGTGSGTGSGIGTGTGSGNLLKGVTCSSTETSALMDSSIDLKVSFPQSYMARIDSTIVLSYKQTLTDEQKLEFIKTMDGNPFPDESKYNINGRTELGTFGAYTDLVIVISGNKITVTYYQTQNFMEDITEKDVQDLINEFVTEGYVCK